MTNPSTRSNPPVRLDRAWLGSLGLGLLPARIASDLIEAAYEEIESTVGQRLAERLDDDQMAAFEELLEREDDAGALAFLEASIPDYPIVVREEVDVLEASIRAGAVRLLEELAKAEA